MAVKMKSNVKTIAVSRYGWIVLLLSFIFIAIVVQIIKIKYVEGSMWRELGKAERVKKDREILPNRGNIYADDGRLLAISQPLYGIYMDFMAEGINTDTLKKYVDPLSKSLAKKFPDRNAAQYKKIILDGWELGKKETAAIKKLKELGSDKKIKPKSRYVRIIRPDINYLDYRELRTFPFLKLRTNQNGLIAEERTTRIKPFGNLAGRTVGSIYRDVSKGGASGLELKYDSIIRGVSGIKSRQHIQGRWIDVIEVEPQDGLDIKTTINVDIQDFVEKALNDKLVETNAESGCAVIMEVATGEIKAIANLDRIAGGRYVEGNPNAFSYMSEPGSTFKAISLMVALEDGVVTPNDSVYVGNGLYQYKGATIRDHDWRKGIDKGYITIREGIYTSSNVAVAKMILKNYQDKPEKFVQKIHELGIADKQEWDVPLKGREGSVSIRFPNNKDNPWSKTTLPWMSFGYETQMPPIYMLMFYNGIANNGKMIKPFMTKAFMKGGKIEKEFNAEVINNKLCSDKTLEQVKDILQGVVTKGTGRPVKSDLVSIAGKTGTALIASHGGYEGSYYVSFCGFFPTEDPKYTCFVGIRRPQGPPSGGLMPGAVFKSIAEAIYARDMVLNPLSSPKDTLHMLHPTVKNGLLNNTISALSQLKQPYIIPTDKAEWIVANFINGEYQLQSRTPRENKVPNVQGLGARDALYLLESSGLSVKLIGSGKVREQSIEAGSPIVKGSTITIQLN